MNFSNQPVDLDSIPAYETLELTPLPDAAKWVAVITWLIFFLFAAVISIAGRMLSIPRTELERRATISKFQF